MSEYTHSNSKPMVELCYTTPEDIITEYKAEKYTAYVIAQSNYNMYHKFSDLMEMIDNGIACNMFTQEEIKAIIAEQDELTQRILLAQYGKYLMVK